MSLKMSLNQWLTVAAPVQPAIAVLARLAVVDAIAVANVKAGLGAVPPDCMLDEPRENLREAAVEAPGIEAGRRSRSADSSQDRMDDRLQADPGCRCGAENCAPGCRWQSCERQPRSSAGFGCRGTDRTTSSSGPCPIRRELPQRPNKGLGTGRVPTRIPPPKQS